MPVSVEIGDYGTVQMSIFHNKIYIIPPIFSKIFSVQFLIKELIFLPGSDTKFFRCYPSPEIA